MAAVPQKTIDLIELVKDGRHFAEKRGPRIHIIDSLTGRSVAVYTDSPGLPTQFIETELPNGTKVWVEETMNPVIPSEKEVPYNPIIVDLICQEIAKGGSLTVICEDTPGFPTYTTFCRWRRKHPEIDVQLRQARADRAEFHRDEAMRTAREATGRDPATVAGLQIEAHKWAAGVDDSKYSPKAKVEAVVNAPTQIIISTGIDRTPIKDVTPKAEVPE